MKYGSLKNYKCPKCENIMSKRSLISGNTCGSKMYSDGNRISPMLQMFPLITKCSKCKTIFWLSFESKTEKQNAYGVEYADFLTINELNSALEINENKTKIKQKIIRQMIWWAFNDRLRNKKELFNSENDKKLWEENIRKLISLLTPPLIPLLILLFNFKDTERKITLAELHRNIGNFKKCRKIIGTIYNVKFFWLKKRFKIQIKKKNTMLFELN